MSETIFCPHCQRYIEISFPSKNRITDVYFSKFHNEMKGTLKCPLTDCGKSFTVTYRWIASITPLARGQ